MYHDVHEECKHSIEMARLGYMLANGKLTEQDANDIIYWCQPIAGWFPLETVSVETVVQGALDAWDISEEEITPIVKSAVRRVWHKWGDNGELSAQAADWALDLTAEYAADAGIELHEHAAQEVE